MKCRVCDANLSHTFLNLGHQPPSNSLLTREKLSQPEVTFPLVAMVCDNCRLVQVPESKSANEIFDKEYVYFSSGSRAWLDHSSAFAKMAKERFKLNKNSKVVEIASNDGYLLKNFVEMQVPCLGIEPASGPARTAKINGIPTLTEFFNSQLASKLSIESGKADLIIGNNVLAHVPGLNDFVQGMNYLLKPQGTITMEFTRLHYIQKYEIRMR